MTSHPWEWLLPSRSCCDLSRRRDVHAQLLLACLLALSSLAATKAQAAVDEGRADQVSRAATALQSDPPRGTPACCEHAEALRFRSAPADC